MVIWVGYAGLDAKMVDDSVSRSLLISCSLLSLFSAAVGVADTGTGASQPKEAAAVVLISKNVGFLITYGGAYLICTCSVWTCLFPSWIS